MKPRIAVIGAGPAGLTAAIAAARNPALEVTLLESSNQPGRKILASGGGKCNLTNVLTPQQLIAQGYGEAGHFVRPALLNFPPQKLRDFFAELGVTTDCLDDQFHYFPGSRRAADVLAALLEQAKRSQVNLQLNEQVTFLARVNDGFAVSCKSGGQIFQAVILANGTPAAPQLGGNRFAGDLPKQLGHTVVPMVPALAGLLCQTDLNALSGVSLPQVKAGLVEEPKISFDGTLLFTGKGVSGTAILDLSGTANRRLQEHLPANLTLQLQSGGDLPKQLARFNLARQNSGGRTLRRYLSEFLPLSLADYLLNSAKIDRETTLARLTGAKRDQILALLTNWRLPLKPQLDFALAMAADGGVERGEVTAKNLMSKLAPGCFFAGEILDVVGRCGGYNLQWAFSSGVLAGDSAAKFVASHSAASSPSN